MDETQPNPVTPSSAGDTRPVPAAPAAPSEAGSFEETRPIPVGLEDWQAGKAPLRTAEEGRKVVFARPVELPLAPSVSRAESAEKDPSLIPPPPPNWPDREGWLGGKREGGKTAGAEIAWGAERDPSALIVPPSLVGPDVTETRPIPTGVLHQSRFPEESPIPSLARPTAPPASQLEKRSISAVVAPNELAPAVLVQRGKQEQQAAREARDPARRTAMRSAGDTTLFPQSRLQRALTLFLLAAAVLMALATVAMAVSVYRPDIFERPLSLPGNLVETISSWTGAPEQGAPIGEQLAERVPLGTPEVNQGIIGGPTIEPGSAIQLTIEALPEGEALEPLPTGLPTAILQPTPESTAVGQSTPVNRPTQETPPADPTPFPTQDPPTPEPTTAPAFNPNQVEAEIGFIEKGSSPTGEQTVTVYIYNFSNHGFMVTASDVTLVPPGIGDLAPLASSPGLPFPVDPGQTVEITFTFPTPASGTGTFKLFTAEFELGDF